MLGTRRIRALLGGLVAALLLAVPGPPAFAQSDVTIRVFQFQPAPLEVTAGTRVTWTNQDDLEHTVTSGTPEQPDGKFGVTLAGKGATGVVLFTTPGVYPYFCARHQSMRGEIRVK